MKNLLSIDVEDWFQVENLKQAISRESWISRTSRIDRNINLLLDILDNRNIKATFFVLGWIAQQYPQLIKKIHSLGHEIACHGYNHQLVYTLSQNDFKNDVKRAKTLLEDIIGENLLGYRAPSFSITDWAVDILTELGFKYDSSLFLTSIHTRYGNLNRYKIQESPIFKFNENLSEIVLSSLLINKIKLPWAGGFYFRFIPYIIFRAGIKKIIKNKGVYAFYIHPWEFDPYQPVIKDIKFNYKLRHYSRLRKTEKKFDRLLSEFEFCPFKDGIENVIE